MCAAEHFSSEHMKGSVVTLAPMHTQGEFEGELCSDEVPCETRPGLWCRGPEQPESDPGCDPLCDEVRWQRQPLPFAAPISPSQHLPRPAETLY